MEDKLAALRATEQHKSGLGIRAGLLLTFGFGFAFFATLMMLAFTRVLHVVAPDAPEHLMVLLSAFAAISGLLILVLMWWVITRQVTEPIDRLREDALRIASGTLQAGHAMQGARELIGLGRSLRWVARELEGDKLALRERVRELEERSEELRAAQGSLVRSEKLASVGRLAAGLAHEVGNPLTSILGMIELLQGGDLEPKEQQEFLSRMQRETERIHRIVRQLLDFSRDTSQQAGPQSALNLAEIVEETVRLIAPQKDMSRIQIERRFPEDLPLVSGNRDGLIQVCLNMLLNAADAMHDEGAIVIDASEVGASVHVSFRDSGPGIATADLEKIFEPFFTTKEAGSGTGLGLAVCQSLVEGMGGRIAAENAHGGGARFRITLPKSPTAA